MKFKFRNIVVCIVATLVVDVSAVLAQDEEYLITVMPPGEPTPRLPNGKPDFTGMWLPNSAGQGVSGRFGVDPEASRQYDSEVTPEARPQFLPEAAERIANMSEIELELSKSSVNCMPRGVPAIWLQNRESRKSSQLLNLDKLNEEELNLVC